jgi:hypothetical protein
MCATQDSIIPIKGYLETLELDRENTVERYSAEVENS